LVDEAALGVHLFEDKVQLLLERRRFGAGIGSQISQALFIPLPGEVRFAGVALPDAGNDARVVAGLPPDVGGNASSSIVRQPALAEIGIGLLGNTAPASIRHTDRAGRLRIGLLGWLILRRRCRADATATADAAADDRIAGVFIRIEPRNRRLLVLLPLRLVVLDARANL